MAKFPSSALLERRLPKDKLQKHLREHACDRVWREHARDRVWVDDIERLTVSHKFTPANTRLKETPECPEILVIRADLKSRSEHLEALGWLAAVIPHPLLLCWRYGTAERWAVWYRRSGAKPDKGALYSTGWQELGEPELSGATLEEAYLHLVGLWAEVSQGETLKRSELDERLVRKQNAEELRGKIARLEVREKKSVQAQEKWQLHQEKCECQAELDKLSEDCPWLGRS